MSNDGRIRDLGDGLILRRTTVGDIEDLVAFHCTHHPPPGAAGWVDYTEAWIRELMTGRHPTFNAEDFSVVIDTRTDEIVSSLNLISQTWLYEGIEFEVGQLELFTTHPDYRRRGLVREQVGVVHQWSTERGHKLQAISGIPVFYRQFGYELCLDLGGCRIGYLPHIPRLKEGEEERYSFRPATLDDVPGIMASYACRCRRDMISCRRDEAIWEFELSGRSEQTRGNYEIIQNTNSEPVGFIVTPRTLLAPVFSLQAYELKSGVSWLDVTPGVIRHIELLGKELAEKNEEVEFVGYRFNLGAEHPAYDVLPERMPRMGDPYAWYIRVPDLPGFLRHIGPVLEKRLAESPAAGHTGDLRLNFFRSGVTLTFEEGSLAGVQAYTPKHVYDGDMLFPDLTFLRALFGHTSSQELEAMYADCRPLNDRGRALVKFLFPKRASHVWALS